MSIKVSTCYAREYKWDDYFSFTLKFICGITENILEQDYELMIHKRGKRKWMPSKSIHVIEST